MEENRMTLEEIDGDRYPDLMAAQRLALPGLAEELAAALRMLLSQGMLANCNGSIGEVVKEKNS